MWYQNYDFILAQFEKGRSIVDETVFYFQSDPAEEEHYIGYLPQYEKPYWAGLCDTPGGVELETAKELFEAKIYDGMSLKQRWPELVIVSMGGVSVSEMDESWFE